MLFLHRRGRAEPFWSPSVCAGPGHQARSSATCIIHSYTSPAGGPRTRDYGPDQDMPCSTQIFKRSLLLQDHLTFKLKPLTLALRTLSPGGVFLRRSHTRAAGGTLLPDHFFFSRGFAVISVRQGLGNLLFNNLFFIHCAAATLVHTAFDQTCTLS
ncbi:hypothetical protein FB451DRAFT_1214518 [Mycena latifolia]|nr:hypothetical protein FB451DRAFT_1214518 [Mycena latifolia]